ncbi:unnamed protein product, partial [Ceratitis capitata]
LNAGFDDTTLIEHSKISLQIIKDELSEIWTKTKAAYDKCVKANKNEDSLAAVKAKQATIFKDYPS